MTVASQVKQTLASLKGARGTIRMYTMQTRDDWRRPYSRTTIKEHL